MNGRILVVGATGRVGGAAVRHLLEAGLEVRALVRSAAGKGKPLRGEPLRALGAEVRLGDVRRLETLAPALEGCAGVFSALSSGTDREAETVEYRGNVNLLSAARRAGARRFVYSSALLADHPLARRVGTLGEKARFEEVLAAARATSPPRSCARSCSWRPCSWPSADPWPSCPAGSGSWCTGSPRATRPAPPPGPSRGA